MKYCILGIIVIVSLSSCTRNKSWVCTSQHVDGKSSIDIVPSATRSQIKNFEVTLRSSPDVVSTKCEVK